MASAPANWIPRPPRISEGMQQGIPPPAPPTAAATPEWLVRAKGGAARLWGGHVERWRGVCGRVVTHRSFEPCVLVLIALSSVHLALEWPGYNSDDPPQQVLFAFEWLFICLFVVEALVRVAGMGLWRPRLADQPSYLQSRWCNFDLVVIVVSILCAALNDYAFLRSLRAFRALRPLRLVRAVKGMRKVVASLFKALPAVGNLIGVAGIFCIMYAIIGVQLFGGRLGICLDPLYSSLPYSSRLVPASGKAYGLTDFEDCMALPRYNLSRHTTTGVSLASLLPADERSVSFPRWVQRDLGTFDTLPHAVLALLEAATSEGWDELMYTVIDIDFSDRYIAAVRARDGSLPPDLARQPWAAAIYFCLWIVLGRLVLLNMVVSIVLREFDRSETNGIRTRAPQPTHRICTHERDPNPPHNVESRHVAA